MIGELYDESLAAARAAFASQSLDVLSKLGWWDLLHELGDREARIAAFSVFRAQGRELGGSAALGFLMAAPFLWKAGAPDNAALAPHATALAIPRRSARRGHVWVLVGDPSFDHVLVDRPGHGAGAIPMKEVGLRRIEIAGRMALHELELDVERLQPIVREEQAAAARRSSAFLGRIAAAFEIVGAAEGALALAVEHARTREQFGEPIGRFQAVRHLLARASVEHEAMAAVAAHAAELHRCAPPRYDEISKALAGRNGRRVCEKSLQVLGAIGFTAEHPHHHFHSRVLALDALLGTSSELASGLGAWLRQERPALGLTESLLYRQTAE